MLAEANRERQNYRFMGKGKVADTCMCCKHTWKGRLPSAWYPAHPERNNNFCKIGGFRLTENYWTCDKHETKTPAQFIMDNDTRS